MYVELNSKDKIYLLSSNFDITTYLIINWKHRGDVVFEFVPQMYEIQVFTFL